MATQQVTLGGDGEVVPVPFEMVPDAAGRKTLALRVVPPPRDTYAGDDQQEVDIDFVDRKTHVLLFAGGPTREYQFLRNQLRRDKDVSVDVLLQTGAEGISQDANEILDEFPATREELFEYDCIVAFDPNWQALSQAQIESLERWVSVQAGGMIVVAGPIYSDTLAQDPALAKVRALYPVEFHRRFSALDDGRYGSKEPWPIEFTREGNDAEFLWIEDSGPASTHAWSEFKGIYGFYSVKGPKPAATVYARFSDPRAGEGGQQPVYFAGQFFGAGRVFYLGSGEMWRLRSVDEAFFERFYTKLIRFVSQGRLLRGSNRGVLLVERDRYVLGNTVAVRAQLNGAQLEPLVAPQVTLQVYLPDTTQQVVVLLADPSRPGSFAGQFTVRKEGVYRLELAVPESADERLARRIQVKVPDLEREKPQRNDALLTEIATKTGGAYYVGLPAALGTGSDEGPLVRQLRDSSRTTIQLETPIRLWDNWWMFGRRVWAVVQRVVDSQIGEVGVTASVMAIVEDRPRLDPGIRDLLAQLRGQIWRYIWIEGIAASVATLCAAFWLALAADYYFEPAPAVRYFLLLAGATATATVFYRFVLRRMAVPLTDSRLALFARAPLPLFRR